MKKIIVALMIIALSGCRDLSGSTDDVTTNKKLGRVVGADKDEKGCVASAGYTFSVLRDSCVRPFETGIRLNSVKSIESRDVQSSAFAILEEDGNRAEIFVPQEKSSIILKRKSEGDPYEGNHWKLQTTGGFALKKGDSLLYAGAKINETVVTGSDNPEE
ncbi:hypothetical protein GV828_02100 [Flavobacterium sp. NST-5]|uniref:Lipoprotein n=1 Tax=Flavobacterium ichthyis TaxID=2698827 RepID=A0ABW9Z9G3_9FLAO|nr:hypothetical protein [Flavobacterium ichthyis]NBL63987.1 hypothetical protein [Flavobacterium ichthyis]